MPAKQVEEKLLSWGSDVEPNTLQQAARASRLPFVVDHVALMPDAHVGIGATVGSVIPTEGAIIPAAVGVDLGCGMNACETDLFASDLPDSLASLMPLIAARVPSGVGKGHESVSAVSSSYDKVPRELLRTELSNKQEQTAAVQFGTLGSGNHFVEVCLDERDRVWTVLHSGSRGIGNQLAQKHIANARGIMRERLIKLEDPDLAYLIEKTPEFVAYIGDMLWAQNYAYYSRAAMSEQVTRSLFEVVGRGRVVSTTNCHHNFTQRETFNGRELWITRKGAIKADVGDRGVIPGSMGTRTYVVEGTGSAASWNSCSHGAGRRMSRGDAKRQLSVESLVAAMGDREWNAGSAASLVDEHPAAYKDIDQVMEDQKDLVTVLHTLRQVFNYKGV